MRQLSLSSDFFSRNRTALAEKIGSDSLALIQAAPHAIRNSDNLHQWRQDSTFFYYTGIDVPDCSLVLAPSSDGKNSELLFIPMVDPEKEKWGGKMLTKEEATQISGIKAVHTNDSLRQALFRVQKWRETLYCDLDEFYPDLSLTPQHLLLSDLRQRLPGLQQKKLSFFSSPMRIRKHPEEIELIKESLGIIGTALETVMTKLRPGLMEYQIEAELTFQYLYNGCERHGFDPIVAGGKNATALHYIKNTDQLKDGDLVLIDTGGEYRMYSGDITRVFPVNGRFSDRQKQCYQAVLDVNKAFIGEIKPGSSWNQLHELASQITGEIYAKQGFIDNPNNHLTVSYHKIGHFLGLDIHDVGRPDEIIGPGTVITVEPGLYLSEEGIGIRIEDNVLVTETGCDVLSKEIPKEIEEIETLMNK
ncbi:aminopeptidase P N-terminal domain-containing protein [bacterium]|nr:aminopeptidase P N-terminal domain-containing protein [bacterium]